MLSFLNTRLLTLMGLMILLTVFSCKKDDDDDATPDPPGPTYNFINQTLQGKINGATWIIVSGSGDVSSFDPTNISIEMFEVIDSVGCGSFLSGNSVFFTCPNGVGLYELTIGGSTNSQTVTLFEQATFLNIISSSGAIEILSIDTVAKLVTGRLDAQHNANSYVNGNFTITYCD